MEHKRWYHILFGLITGGMLCPLVPAADTGDEAVPFAFSGGAAVVSKYLWRGQRLTNDWSLQPSGTFSLGNFSVNVWGNLDLAAVNEGDALFIPENPAAPPGDHNGLQGKFSEVDYTFSYLVELAPASLDVGAIVYTFPERSASLPSTVEVYGGVEFGELPLAPSAKLFVDVDETGEKGDAGVYLLLAGGHQIPFRHSRFPGLDVTASLGLVNRGFSRFYYGAGESGVHDFNLTLSAPIALGEHLSAGAFVSYSALLGEFRNYQFRDLRAVYRGTAGSPAAFADTVWGGFNLNVDF